MATTPETELTPLTLTVAQAAKLLGISRWAAYAAAASGELPAIKIRDRVLISRPALDEMLRTAGKSAAGH